MFTTTLTVISLVFGVIGGVFGFTQWARRLRQRLEARVVKSEFAMPIDPKALIDVYRKASVAALEEQKPPSDGPSVRSLRLPNFWDVKELDDQLLTDLRIANSLFTLKIENRSKIKVTGVTVKMPEAFTIAEVRRGDEINRVKGRHASIPVGDLMPHDTAQVRIWCHTFGYSDAATVRVSHESGVAKVRAYYETTHFWHRVSTIIEVGGLSAILFAVAMTGVLILMFTSLATGVRRDNDALSPTPTATPTVTATPSAQSDVRP